MGQGRCRRGGEPSLSDMCRYMRQGMQEISRNQTEQVHVVKAPNRGQNYELTLLLPCKPMFVGQRVRGEQRMAVVIMDGFVEFWTGTCFGRI